MGWLDLKAVATDSADWIETIEIANNDTGQGYDVSAFPFRIEVTEKRSALLVATTEVDGGITRPTSSQIKWRFTKDQMATLCAGKTYDVGCTYVDGDGNTIQFIVGTVAVVSGAMSK